MRILIVTQYFWPENFKINDFALGMKKLGHHITVLTGKPNYPSGNFFNGYKFLNKRTEFYEGIEVIRSPLFTRGKSNGVRLFLNYFSFAFFSCFTALFRVRGKFDVVFVYEPSPVTVGIPAIVLKWKFEIPLFFWVQDLWPETVQAAGMINNRFLLGTLNKLVSYIYKKSDKIFISSMSFAGSICQKKISTSRIVYFPNWPEEIYLNTKIDKERYSGLMPAGFKIMFAGNIGEAQDFDSILMTANLLKVIKIYNG
ncbi:MAG: glycosyltransferase family 4 protein [Bacteroidetes bacterium]|nr:glycosyltransferase family 4 protein [Bacteroidota bacterium]